MRLLSQASYSVYIVPRKVIVILLIERTDKECTEAEAETLSKVYRVSLRRVFLTTGRATARLDDVTLEEQGNFDDNSVAKASIVKWHGFWTERRDAISLPLQWMGWYLPKSTRAGSPGCHSSPP